ncbi:hypothetical protein SLS53_007782 [Cytospora paraplurivora]|uniref:Uncharacterized protein n=1 Tax=Cytospora paraplurivora TaxID=2898453 RepID=A0AAN9U0B7_9PEZI
MASKKDMRRADLVIPYQEPLSKPDTPEIGSTISQTLPMGAIFLRNRYIGWAAVVFSVQNWLGESEDNQKNSSTPGYFAVGMSLMSLIVTYLPIFLPPPPGTQGAATGTEAAAPIPPA